MITDYSALLLVLTLATGAIWLLEMFYLSPRRNGVNTNAADVVPAQKGEANAAASKASIGQPLWVEYTAGFFPALAAVFVLRAFLFEPFFIPSGSMTPTLLIGDRILVNKFTYGIRLPILNKKILQMNDPKPGDVTVFRHPRDPSIDLIKRVVGIPGDHIDYRNKRLTINGKALAYQARPDYLGEENLKLSRQYGETLNGVEHAVLEIDGHPAVTHAPDNFQGHEFCNYDSDGFSCTVPQGQYFMMGDNRDNSEDSRYWGFVPDANIVGKALSVWMNFHHFGHIGAIR